MLLETYDLSINFGKHQVLDKVNLKITKESRIGLIGVNGAGKSTLLKCLTGELYAQEGKVNKTANVQVQCLRQNPELKAGNTLEQELYGAFSEIDNLEEYEIEARIGRMVTGLGFKLEDLKEPVENFSGGWQMRINLAKVLLQEADILLMDEPTNHLDREACEWLEEFLRSYPKGILIVSHDRHFLDEVVTEIAELERGILSIYPGNYTNYVTQKQINREHQANAAQRQEKNIAKQKAFVERFRASATKSTQAKSREKQLAKIDIIDAPKGDLKKLSFKFPLAETSGRQVVKINKVSKGFEGKTLFENISAELEWTKEEPQRVFILGANGCGKTTLFKMLLGIESCDSGEISFGSRVSLGYYAQHQLQILDPNKTVLETLEDIMPPTDQGEIRSMLGHFLFSADQVFKKVETLSGGEKARLAIAKLMVGGPNTLLLDEPTNHLDTSAQEAIEDALKHYQGTVICISHDRYLIENHASQIWEFHQGSLFTFDGDYQYYLEKRQEKLNIDNTNAKKTPNTKVEDNTKKEISHHERHQLIKQQEKRLKSLDKSIAKLHSKEESLNSKINDPKFASNYQKLEEFNKELETVKLELSQAETEWLELSEKLEV